MSNMSENCAVGNGNATLYPSLNNLESEIGNLIEESDSATARLIYSCSNSYLYFISDSGRVTLSSGPETMRIFEIDDDQPIIVSKYYLQIYTFVYPLVQQVSPVVRTEFSAIVLPNINPDECSADTKSVGLIVPKEHEEEFILVLENILDTKIVYCDTRSADSVSKRIAGSIISGAECVSNLLINGAQKAEQFMDENTPKLIEKINPGETTQRVNPCVKSGIKIAREVTAVTANVTGFVASKVGAATVSLGQFLAPHIRRRGSQILSQTIGMSQNKAVEKVDSVINVTAGAVEGFCTIYGGLEQSARIFGRSLNDNSVEIIKHKYGHSAAEFTQDTFETVSNGIEIGTHISFFKPKNLAKSAAKGVFTAKSENLSKSTSSSTRRASSELNNSSIVCNSLIEVQNNISADMPRYAIPPAAFSSEVLRPVVISPTCHQGIDVSEQNNDNIFEMLSEKSE